MRETGAKAIRETGGELDDGDSLGGPSRRAIQSHPEVSAADARHWIVATAAGVGL